jgi:3-oxochol-4-en-24-oyl-CoA dehydrogenase
MSIAIAEDHRTLADTAADFLLKNRAREAAREQLEASAETRPEFWDDLLALGWLGLHLPEEYGGSGYGLEELVVVAEELGRAVAPGPFIATAIVSAVIDAAGSDELKGRVLPGLAAGTTLGGVSLGDAFSRRDGALTGTGTVLSGEPADLVLVPVSDDVALIEKDAAGVTVETPTNIDPTRRTVRLRADGTPVEMLPGARRVLVDLARTLLAAEATGVARECTGMAAEYAKVREQFGRPIAMYQAVKHHCANMLVATELATAAVWDAARAAAKGDDQRSYTAAMAATLAVPAAEFCASLNIQVHGGIGFTYEHDAHLYLRRATAIAALIDADTAAADVTDLTRAGVKREKSVDLPPEAEAIRDAVREFAESIKDKDADAQRAALIESGYVMPHWPEPWGRGAGAVEQLVIEQEFKAAGVTRPQYQITGWVILTLIQHATEDQVARWVPPALRQDLIWCQLFSEPDAGSDAAGIKTRGTKVEGGWKVNGQKVWTSGAHIAKQGLATVRTDPDAPKHNGITTMVIDMEADGVEVRPLKMPTGNSEFNEVFFNDVFVPDDDVVGPVNGGWTVARATLGNESVSIGGGDGGMSLPGQTMIGPFDAHPDRLPGGASRIGRYIATNQAMGLLNLRSAHRAVAGGGPGPEGNVTKLVISECGHEAAAILSELAGPDGAFLEGDGAVGGMLVLMNRAMSIAGGTSEIKRNQIGERILGLPRDPLIK